MRVCVGEEGEWEKGRKCKFLMEKLKKEIIKRSLQLNGLLNDRP